MHQPPSSGHSLAEMGQDNALRIPDPLRRDVDQIFKLTDPFCGEHLDAWYAELVRTFCRQDLLASNPMAWMISVDGFIVDARTMPPAVQAEGRRRGLIPDPPRPQGQGRWETAGSVERR